MKTRLLIITLAFTGYLFSANSDNFTLVQESDSEIQLNFLLGNFEMVQINGESRVITGAAGKTMEAGLPELPVFTTFIEVKLDRIYSVDYSVESSTIIQDIRLVPATIIEPGAETIDPPQRNEEFYLSGTVYPQAAVSLAEPMIMRNVKILAVKVIPFNYNPGMSELEVFDELNITIRSTGIDPDHVNRQLQPSGVFEELYSSILLNHEPADRSEYQTPAVLYICGGGSSGVIQHPYFQQLVEWRHKRGWVVYTAHTGTTGSGSNQIKNYIEDAYDTFDPPPEIVALVGDVGGTFTVPTFYENWSWYSGEGDHPYSLLDGDDILPEVLVGRISVNSSSDVSNVINKTLHYEKALYMGNNWFEKGAVASDPNDSGMSVADVGMYVEQLMDAHGMEDVRLKIQGSSWASWMENQLDEGLLYFHYRGWGLFSGFDSGNIYALNNGFATPFISFITCGTGSFAQGTSLTEDFIRVGSVNSPKGGVTAIGTATLGTHTVFNNILDMGIWEGVFAKDLDYAGSALASGKLALLTAYPSDPDNKVSMFTHWNNLMGDPALNLWTDTPKIIIMDHPESVGIGSNYIDVQILDEYENPVTDAVVTAVTDNDEIFVSVYTGEDGIAEIPLPLDYSGNVDLTVTKKNCKPVESEFSIYDDGPVVNIDENNLTQDEISGNNDGLINPGEAFSVTIPVYNFGDESAENVAIHVESSSDLLELDNPDGVIAYLEAGGTSAWELTGTVLINAMETDEIQLTVFFMDGSGTQWSSRIPLDLHSPVLIVNGYQIISGGDIEPGSEIELEIFLSNLGTQSVSNVSAMLNFPGYLISFEDSLETWDEIMPGETAVCQGTVVAVFDQDIINDTELMIDVHLTSDDGYENLAYLAVKVGELSVTDPLGPDQHGYFIYDSGDMGYNLALPYDWIEIDPDFGGDGTSLNLNNTGNGNPISQQPGHINLPFTFTFYGVDYNEITVSTNGWIAMGDSDMRSFRNYTVPGAGGPSPMIAAFWDDLITSNGGQVYYLIDEAAGQVIIEWSGMNTYFSGSSETFQVILIDMITPTGDDEILIQYNNVNNNSYGNLDSGGLTHGGYATVGLENHLGNDGLQYTFNNQYPVAAAALEDELALYITTRQPMALLMGDLNQDGIVNIQDIVMVVNGIINIETLDPLARFVADMNSDGIINILDIIRMINYILGN